jgi:hypothetical protein
MLTDKDVRATRASTPAVRLVARQSPQRELEHDHGVHESLLRSVVQIALDPPSTLVGSGHDSRARSGTGGAALDVRHRHRDQFRERAETRLDVPRQRLLLEGLTDDHDPPDVAFDDDRCPRR